MKRTRQRARLSLRNLSITNMALIPIGVMAAAFVLALSGYLAVTARHQEIAAQFEQEALVKLTTIKKLSDVAHDIYSTIFQNFVFASMDWPQPPLAEKVNHLEQNISDLNILFGEILSKHSLDPADRKLLTSVEEPLQDFLKSARLATSSLENPPVAALYIRSASSVYETLDNAIDRFAVRGQEQLKTQRELNGKRLNRVQAVLSIFMFGALVGSALLAHRLSHRGIVRPIRNFIERMRRLAGGDLAPIEQSSRASGEIAGMLRALEVFRENAVDRERLHDDLERERDRAQNYLDTAGVMLLAIDEKAVVTLINRKGCEMLGCAESEVIGKNWFDHFIPDHERARVRSEFDQVMLTGTDFPEHFENRILIKDGGERIIAWHNTTLRFADGEVAGVLASGTDITERLDYQLRLQRLSAHLQEGLERERAMVAREIHDELGQTFTALKMDVSWMRSKLQDEKLVGISDRLLVDIDQAIKTVQRITTSLRPDILDHLGLSAAVKRLADEFATRTGVDCHLVISPGLRMVDPDLSIAAYRIVQESLTNVARHANASNVETSLELDNGCLRIKVRDDGGGLHPDAEYAPGSHGLNGMRERTRALGGSFSIESVPGKGTLLQASIPINGETYDQDFDLR